VNAAIVILTRSKENGGDQVFSVLSAIKQVEDRFNHRFHYPYIFLTDNKHYDEMFIEYVHI
jgi:hypothetical protein